MCVVISRCSDRAAVLQEEEEEEEVTGSLLRGGDVTSSPEEEEGEETCPHLLSVPPVLPRPQSTLHSITLSIQQVHPSSCLSFT